MGIHHLWLFVVAGFLLNITPGPDMALIIAKSTQRGTRAGIAAAIGIATGLFIHIAAAAIGISAIIAASAAAFMVLKWAGALYLIYLGAGLLWSSQQMVRHTERRYSQLPFEFRRVFVQGFLTNVLNPKIALFFLAFLPQFVDVDAPSKSAALFSLGLLFNVVGTVWNFGVAWFAAALTASQSYAYVRLWLERALGVLLVGIGIKLALLERS
jgi:threonine/homoserine/homoserine lactone efflux protein